MIQCRMTAFLALFSLSDGQEREHVPAWVVGRPQLHMVHFGVQAARHTV